MCVCVCALKLFIHDFTRFGKAFLRDSILLTPPYICPAAMYICI